jgi:hypothetical protein
VVLMHYNDERDTVLINTAKEIIEILSKYQPDEQLLITWWSQEDVEMTMSDSDVEPSEPYKPELVWGEIITELDDCTSDIVITLVNQTMDELVAEQIKKGNEKW